MLIMNSKQLGQNFSSRRSFVAQSLTGIASAALLPSQLNAAPIKSSVATAKAMNSIALAFDPRSKLRAISARAKQLWPVIYVDPADLLGNAERDVESSLEGGADAVVLEFGKDPAPLEKALAHVRQKYPKAKVGVNYLGGEGDPYGYLTSFRLAKEYGLHIVWTDFCGVDKIKELPEISLHEIEAHRFAGTFYCSGIHMKYGTLLDPNKPLEQSALQAMGWVEGIIITGPKTGIPTDPERAKKVRRVIGPYPLGVASGVSAENFHTIGDSIDFCLVNTSISDPNHRIIAAKVRSLRQAMG